MMRDERCSNCKYNSRDKDRVDCVAWMCINEASDYYMDYTSYDDYCEDWEAKDE